ncbi:MAG: Fe-S cluster assembly protein SufB, partial [Candidatus Limiplasma sp.]|nr:Fe-S cluster assembly protein SufB [Candidatus Limiplasma sp.]
MERNKTQVVQTDRAMYDVYDPDSAAYQVSYGLTEAVVEEISRNKQEPSWMLQHRLKSLHTYQKLGMPKWGPSLHELDMDQIVTYVKPKATMTNDWQTLPDDIRGTFERLGIPEAEWKSLSGVGAQYDSEVVYHSMRDQLKQRGVV